MIATAHLLKKLSVLAIALAAILAPCATAIAIDPADYGSLPTVKEVKISPDGAFIAHLETVDDISAVSFHSVGRDEATPISVNIGTANPRSLVWANNDVVLLLVSESMRVRTDDGPKPIEFFRWLAVSQSQQTATTLFANEPGFYLSEAGVFYTVRNSDADKAVFGRYTSRAQSGRATGGADNRRHTIRERFGRASARRGFVYSLFEIDLESGAQTLLHPGNDQTVNWITDANGDPVLRIDYDRAQAKKQVYKKRSPNGDFEMLNAFEQPRGEPSPIVFFGLTKDRSNAVISVLGNHNRREIRMLDLATGAIGDVVLSDPFYDVDGVVYDPQEAAAIGASYIDHMTRVYYLDKDDQATKNAIIKALPNAASLITSRSRDGKLFTIEANYTDRPKRFFLFDAHTKRLTAIAESYSKLVGEPKAKKEVYDYTSSDGLFIPGYLTAPRGAKMNKMPLIVLPHGGPWARDNQAFDWWAFFYAARGYLVYQPNFRGSSGYGAAFLDAGNREWGRKMQEDITEGVQKLIGDGAVDPDRICIVGSSYGGYAALAGATLTPDLYQCAVSVNGVSNIPQLLWHRANGEGENQFWKTRVGSRFSDADALRQVSPMYAVTAQTPPIMLIHAEHDVIVQVRQSRRMRNALAGNNIPHEFVILEGEDHWLSTGEMRTQMLRLSIDFIDQHIGE